MAQLAKGIVGGQMGGALIGVGAAFGIALICAARVPRCWWRWACTCRSITVSAIFVAAF